MQKGKRRGVCSVYQGGEDVRESDKGTRDWVSCDERLLSVVETMAKRLVVVLLVVLSCGWLGSSLSYRRKEDKTRCPKVKVLRHFELSEMMGSWFVAQYYAATEEIMSYKCMRAVFSQSEDGLHVLMNFTYNFLDDPENEGLFGNLTWRIPDPAKPAHWIHSEDSYDVVYNTYVLDSDGDWALLLHCAEKKKSPRYLSSLMMSRNASLAPNVVAYLRDKLPRYSIDLEYMFPMEQTHCGDVLRTLHYGRPRRPKAATPLRHGHDKSPSRRPNT